MDKIREVDNTFNHSIQISERKNCLITGVKKLENFNERKNWSNKLFRGKF